MTEPEIWQIGPSSLMPEVWADGQRLLVWPYPREIPTYGDLIEHGGRGYQVIRRRWEPYPHLTRLYIDVQPIPPRGSG